MKCEIQPPFRQDHLLTSSGFSRYCHQYGISVDRNDLETLHRLGLLAPIVRVYLGVIPFRKIYADFGTGNEWRYVYPADLKKFKPKKIEKKTYYKNGGIFMRGNDWLEHYQKQKGMVTFLQNEKFVPWPKPTMLDYTTNAKKIEHACEYLYEKYQLIWLRRVIRAEKILGLRSVEAFDAATKKILADEEKKFSEFMHFYIDSENFLIRWINLREKAQQECRELYKNDIEEAELEWKGKYEATFLPMLRRAVQKLISDHKVTTDQIKNWQHIFATTTLFGQTAHTSEIQRNYLRALDEETLAKAEDANYMIYVLSEILQQLTGEQQAVRQVLGDWDGSRCSVCHLLFNPTKRTQRTCGSLLCQAKYKNELKRKNRKAGRYKSR